jgi:hypothetical protein
MTYSEALEADITRRQAVAEIKKHRLNSEDFFKEVGDRGLYKGAEILNWLGY